MNVFFRRSVYVFCGLATVFTLWLVVTMFALSAPAAALGVVLAVGVFALVAWLLKFTPLWPAGVRLVYPLVCGLWGGCVAVSVAVLSDARGLAQVLRWPEAEMSFGGAFPEETLKALGVVLILFSFRELNRPWHGLVTGMLVGLGFDMSENITYGVMGAMFDPNSDFAGALGLWQLRFVAGPLMHAMLTGLVGFGCGWALFGAGLGRRQREACAVGGYALAFVLHFVWNYEFPGGLWWLGFSVVSVVGYGALAAAVVHSVRRARVPALVGVQQPQVA